MTEDQNLLENLVALFDADRVKLDPASLQNLGKDWTTAYQPAPLAVVFPRSIDEVVALVTFAREHGVALVPSGGRTGLSGGAVAMQGEIVVAFDRMNQILDFNAVDRQLVCEPGVVTEQIQQFALDHELYYPVDFASAGSSQIGGNVATNAGGIKVIRYGLTRDWVLGLKVVTGNGDVLDLNRGLVKNATGYDLRHLFVGSEGTLGLIVEVTLGLTSLPRDLTVLLLGVPDMLSTMKVLEAFQSKLQLTAFEFFSDLAMGHVTAEKDLQRPLEAATPYYALIEFEQDSEATLEAAMALFEHCMEQGWVLDGTMSQNESQRQNLWRFREDISETIARFSPYKNDISVKVSNVPAFLTEVEELVGARYPDFEIVWFGHIGDGNVHLNILKPDALEQGKFVEQCAAVSEGVFEIVRAFGGSISAEHGVGLLKQPFLTYARSDTEIAYLRSIKSIFDPAGILNPGKIFSTTCS